MVNRMTEAPPIRIFLATPGDLADERSAMQACVREHNERRSDPSDQIFEIVGWEMVRGTARRPQDAINDLIASCHFMIVLFKASWGSEPGSPWGYTSGTEEELFTGLLDLGLTDRPMIDVWVGFMKAASPDERINSLKQQFSDRHEMMYESLADMRELKDKFSERLLAWAQSGTGKVTRHIDLLPSSGRDVLRAANLRVKGTMLVSLGQVDAGRDKLKEAAAIGGPNENLAYAQVLRRGGDLKSAYVQTQKAIDHFIGGGPLYSSLAAEAFSSQARVLNDQGRRAEAIVRLERALTLIQLEDDHSDAVRCRILDDLGKFYQREGNLISAREKFETALKIRDKRSKVADVCQSLVNIARLEVAEDRLDAAGELYDKVAADLRGTVPTALHANVGIFAAQLRLRQNRPVEGIPHAEWALAVNSDMGHSRGQAISQYVLAQCHRAAGNFDIAKHHVDECLKLNESMGDEQGISNAQWLRRELEEQSGPSQFSMVRV